MIRIAPSLLSADFARLADELATVEHADLLHLDVMDGHFVPNLTIGPALIKALRKHTKLPFDCHLMIAEPQRYIGAFLDAGADLISIHIETEPHLQRALQMIRDGGAKAGIAINPATSAESLTSALDFCDYILVMTVNPGFGGQKFIEPVVPKIRHIARLVRERGLRVEIEVDGGIDAGTAPRVVDAGASILVAGSAVFGKPDRDAAMRAIRDAVTTTRV
ncbi:MAG: ribulose-phosphate 3-epimerase [Acidobacteria bacterium]|nr:ribulose-phosphate 3-epimerase [Acidobacteriota bacterium]MBV9478589.1 ribulose-phosphate 3-epimerase [Acidobacteriota bacterium]